MTKLLRVETQSRDILWLRQRNITSNGCIRPEIQQAALHLLPLPAVVIDFKTKQVIHGDDIITSLYAYNSDNRAQTRRIEETKLTIYEVYLHDDDTHTACAEWLNCFKGGDSQ